MRRLASAAVVTAIVLSGCGSTKVITRTTVARAQTVTATTTTPAETIATTVTTPASSTTTTTTSASGSLPTLDAGSYSGIRPSTLDFSGDAGNIVTGITWSSWSAAGAVGQGTSNIQGCVPNCAQGSETPVATSVTLSAPQSGHFTQVTEVRHGLHLNAAYPSSGWPEGAS
jgi:hypothetical protein